MPAGSVKLERERLRGMFRALSTWHYRPRYNTAEGSKRPSKYTAIPRARHRLAAVFLICRACSHRTGWAGRRSPAAPSDSQQVLPTNLSVSGRLPRLMGIENFRVGY